VKNITSDTPPIITMHGGLDAVVPFDQAVTFHDLFNEFGIKNELISDLNGKHAGFSEKQFKHIYSGIFNFLDEVIE
jgi:alpha-beta hydrolase superfamily lysophospholipase